MGKIDYERIAEGKLLDLKRMPYGKFKRFLREYFYCQNDVLLYGSRFWNYSDEVCKTVIGVKNGVVVFEFEDEHYSYNLTKKMWEIAFEVWLEAQDEGGE